MEHRQTLAAARVEKNRLMTAADRWKRVNEIVESALELDTALLAEYLDKACAGDNDLRAEVVSLLAMEGELEDFLAVKAIDMVASGLLKGRPAYDATVSEKSSKAVRQTSLIGRKLGDFIIAEKLGAGGFGEIYRATQPVLN